MRGNLLVASAAALAGAVAAAPAVEHETRATTSFWTAVNGTTLYITHGILGGASFDLSVAAGYIAGAPGFHVHCDAYYVYNGAASNGTACSWSGGTQQPAYSTVSAYTDYDTLAVTVYHQFLGGDGYRRVSSAAGTLPVRPQDSTPIPPFPLQVSSVVTQLPGKIGQFGTWSATNADFVRDSARRLRGMQYKLSAPAGYALDAPGFSVSCYYDYNPDPTVFPACTPVGAIAAGSRVALWASVLYNITTVHHEWIAANGTKFQLVGTSDPLPDLGKVTTFTIHPDILNTL
ncbi:hypothetical protein F5B17DRAFT_126894 [Nemania serpens]|nr:hypothetical protein F5B17DRAFT_126894 [Nemania serpens]